LIDKYSYWKSVDPDRPVFLNFAGPDVLVAEPGPVPNWCNAANGYCSWEGNYLSYIGKALDWASNDIYPVGGWLPDESRRNDLSLIGDVMDKIRGWTEKPQFATIECGDQRYVPEAARGLTPGELRAQIWIAVVHGARGICYFSAWFSPPYAWAGYDNTSSENVAEMLVQHSTLTALAPVLQGRINPPSIGATISTPLQIGWRKNSSGSYFIAVNPGGTSLNGATLSLSGVAVNSSAEVYGESRTVEVSAGKIMDSFGPFAVHIYVLK
jgi:hypothetical protein